MNKGYENAQVEDIPTPRLVDKINNFPRTHRKTFFVGLGSAAAGVALLGATHKEVVADTLNTLQDTISQGVTELFHDDSSLPEGGLDVVHQRQLLGNNNYVSIDVVSVPRLDAEQSQNLITVMDTTSTHVPGAPTSGGLRSAVNIAPPK